MTCIGIFDHCTHFFYLMENQSSHKEYHISSNWITMFNIKCHTIHPEHKSNWSVKASCVIWINIKYLEGNLNFLECFYANGLNNLTNYQNSLVAHHFIKQVGNQGFWYVPILFHILTLVKMSRHRVRTTIRKKFYWASLWL